MKVISNVNKKRKSKVAILIALCILLLLLLFVQMTYLEGSLRLYLAAFLWIFTVVVFLWWGNRFIFYRLTGNRSVGLSTPRFLFQLFLTTVYSLCCINLTYYFYKITATSVAPDAAQFLVLNVYGLLFIIPVLSINFGIFFMLQWKKAHILSDKLKEENLNSQLEALKMHLDPHFLFNNLNVLSALIEKQPSEAKNFLDHFAEVYRYVLQYKKEELVALKTELEFLNAYIYLLKQRFNEQLLIRIEVSDAEALTRCVPPMALQMLVENAIKHNKISAQKPLKMSIQSDRDFLIVQNDYQPRMADQVMRFRSGLDNITKRYSYLTDTPIEVVQNEEIFYVKLPLLELEE